MDIRSTGPLGPRRPAIPAMPRSVPAAASSASTVMVQHILPPPSPVTTEMLPSYKAAHAPDPGARQGYAQARDIMKND